VTTRPRLGLTAWLTLLVLGAVVPLLIFGGITLRGLLQSARALGDRGQVDTTRALALAVDGEVRSWRSALLALADSRSLRPGRWSEFYEEARDVAKQYDGWVVLHRATGPQQLNTLRPFGVPLPQTAAPDLVQAVFREGKPVTDMAFGAVAKRHVISNSVPVFRDGKVAFCLSLNFGPERLTRLLQGQQVPATWVAAINDSRRRVVARSRDAEARVGKPVVEWLAAATRAAESGILAGPMIDGRLGQIAFQRLQEAPWVAVLAIPVAELQSAAPIWGFTLVGTILGLAAVGTALYMGRKVTAPVRSLARASEGLLRGEVADLGAQTGVRELQELQQALAHASTAARTHAQDRERAAEALRQANEVLEARVLERTAAIRAANADLNEEIAQRKRAEEKVQTLARFPSENPNPVLRLDSDGRILYANAASAALLRQWGSAVGGQAPAPWPANVRAALASGSGTTVELGFEDRTFAIFVVPVAEAGYVNLYTSDITERKRADEALRESQQRNEFLADVLKSANQPFAVGYPDGRLGLMNHAFEQLTGYGADELRSIEWITTLTPPEWRDQEAQKLDDLHRSGQPVRYEKEYVRKDGTRVPIELLVHLVRDAEGKSEYYYSFVTDITERKQAEERLRNSLHEKEVLLKEIHHRVKNNLQVISSLVSLQADGLKDPRLRDLFRDMRDRIRSMALVHEKLYQSESLAHVEFSDYAGSLLNHLWRTHGTSAAHVRLALKLERLPLSVEIAVPCGLILNELAANALKHAFAGRPVGEVTAALHADPDGRVHLCVRDDGVGLPPGMDWRHTRSLGLQLVQMLTSQINGAVEVRSGAGTEFEITFTLPAAHGQAGEQAQPRGEGRP